VLRASLPPGLIVNADDLGIHPAINAGILSAYRGGILTSCTMLMTTAYLEETVRDYVRPAALPIGIHLSLTLGKAMAPRREVSDLVDGEGNLILSAGRLIMASFAGGKRRGLLDQIRRELEAQLALARDWGLRPTHADSHQHIHMNPAIFALVEELLPRYGIDRLRYCREAFSMSAFGPDLPAILRRHNPSKWVVLGLRSAQITPHLATTQDFFGVLYSGGMTKRALEARIARAPTDRSLEICIHPGFPAPKGELFYPRAGYNDFISSSARQMEHDALVVADLADLVRRRGLVLRAFDGRPKD
jgi:chitin disaccharide deacetylase